MRARKVCMRSLLLSVVATAIGTGMIGVMLTHIVDSYSLASAQEGLMSSCISAGALTALILGILLRSRITKVQFIIGGGLVMSLMLFGKSLQLPFMVFLAVCFVMGTGMGIMDSFQSSFLTDLDPDDANRNLGMMHGIFGLGGVLLPLLLQGLLGIVSWRMGYRLISVICFILVVQFYITTRSVRQELPVIGKLEKSQSTSKISSFLTRPRFLLLLMSMFLAAMAQNGIVVWVIRYVEKDLGNPSLAPLCLSLFWVSTTISRIFAPRLPVQPIKFLTIGSFICAGAWIIGIASDSAPVMLVVCFAAGLFSGCGMPVLLAESAGISHGNTGLVTNMMMFIKSVGQFLMPLIVSAVINAAGFKNAMYLVGIAFIADGAAIAGSWIIAAKEGKGVCA